MNYVKHTESLLAKLGDIRVHECISISVFINRICCTVFFVKFKWIYNTNIHSTYTIQNMKNAEMEIKKKKNEK